MTSRRRAAVAWEPHTYTRAYAAAGSCDRISLPAAPPDAWPAYLSAGRRALVLSAARTF